MVRVQAVRVTSGRDGSGRHVSPARQALRAAVGVVVGLAALVAAALAAYIAYVSILWQRARRPY